MIKGYVKMPLLMVVSEKKLAKQFKSTLLKAEQRTRRGQGTGIVVTWILLAEIPFLLGWIGD